MIRVKSLPEPPDLQPIRRALLSVFDKTGLVDFAKALHRHGVQLISTGGTAKAIADAGMPVTEVSSLTGYPEILDGRVKTLHPVVHGGLLARHTDPEDLAQLAQLNVEPIDLVVVNLYPFSEAVARPDITDSIAIENIDIGGPTMVRAAAKNFFFVAAVTAADQYDSIVEELDRTNGHLSMRTRRQLAHRAFEHTAVYDRAVATYFAASEDGAPADDLPPVLSLKVSRHQPLRYGENPHQRAAMYGNPESFYEKLHGKELSFNNIIDLSAALFLIDEFGSDVPACAILKHTNPCGVAIGETLVEAYRRAFATDIQSPFGGIVVVNKVLDLATAQAVDEIFTEIIIAPEFGDGVLDLLRKKQNRRIIRSRSEACGDQSLDVRSVLGGLLVQDRDPKLAAASETRSSWKVVTRRAPTDREWRDLDFAWRVAKHVKSNAIVYAKDGSTIGIGAGQMSRVDSSEIAVMKGKKSGLDFTGSVVASDAFFPFADGLIAAAQTGARAVVQPGGSVRDEEVIAAADEHGIAMVFTGVRHFRH
ncbi:MAG TPA: bifunctional phosphoribosylaminoimidazolecarboxamide formyltransferase/IMP cyclohydrolase [Rhodothermales bacterium]